MRFAIHHNHGVLQRREYFFEFAARAFADRYHDETNITVLVDFENDSVRTSLEVADIFRAAGPSYRAAHAGI